MTKPSAVSKYFDAAVIRGDVYQETALVKAELE
jgi:hypothetical protein